MDDIKDFFLRLLGFNLLMLAPIILMVVLSCLISWDLSEVYKIHTYVIDNQETIRIGIIFFEITGIFITNPIS